ncbi:hypothetical protein [Kitasatospora sp. NPDC004272]
MNVPTDRPRRVGPLARRLAYRARTVSWTALSTLCALLGPAAVAVPGAVAETGPVPGTADG